MDLCENFVDLESYINLQGKTLVDREVLKISKQIVDALEYCHNKNIYHLD